MKKPLLYLVYALCGVLMALPYSVETLWPVAWIAFVPVLVIELSSEKVSKHTYLYAARRGFCFFYPYAVMTWFWFFEMYPLEFTGLSRAGAACVVLLGVLGLPLLQVAAWILFFQILTFVRVNLCDRFPNILMLLLVPSVWVFLEWIQTKTWAGVPWGKLALGQVHFRAAVQSASLFGPYFISFLVILCAVLISFSVMHFREHGYSARSVLCLFAVAAVFGGNVLFGALRISGYREDGESVRVSAIQGNIDSKEKWSSDIYYALDTYRELSVSAAADGAELIVLPETAIPVRITENTGIKDYVENIADSTGSSILVGAFHYGADSGLENSVFLVEPQNGLDASRYSKRRLVPFGEFVPWRSVIMTLVPPLNGLTIIGEDLVPGDGPQLIETKYGIVGPIICFDSIYEEYARESTAGGAQLLCVSTNDSWFGDSSAVYEHNNHSVLRAIENGRYVVRAANTGISSVITPIGEVIGMLEPLVRGNVTCDVKMISEKTLYTRIGDIPVYVSVPFVFICTAVSFVFYVRRKSDGH